MRIYIRMRHYLLEKNESLHDVDVSRNELFLAQAIIQIVGHPAYFALNVACYGLPSVSLPKQVFRDIQRRQNSDR